MDNNPDNQRGFTYADRCKLAYSKIYAQMSKWQRQCVDEGNERHGMEMAREVAEIAENDGKWESVLAGFLGTKYGKTLTYKKSKPKPKSKPKSKSKHIKNPPTHSAYGKRIIDWEALHKSYGPRRTEADKKEEAEFDKKWIKDAGFDCIEDLLAFLDEQNKYDISDEEYDEMMEPDWRDEDDGERV